MIRNSVVAGTFYPISPPVLMRDLHEMMDSDTQKTDAKAIVVPHAGYMYSGNTAGKVYSHIKPAPTYVIFGPNHYGVGPDFSINISGRWITPLGQVDVDSRIAKDFYLNCEFLEEDFLAHEREHSIEVQLPFLQAIGDNFNIIPIAIKHYQPDQNFHDRCVKVAESITSVLSKIKSEVILIASTDFTHYEDQKTASEKDMLAIKAILDFDSKKLFEVILENDISMCGYAGVAITLEVCKNMGVNSSRLLEYSTSGDVTGDTSQVVGYAGMLFE